VGVLIAPKAARRQDRRLGPIRPGESKPETEFPATTLREQEPWRSHKANHRKHSEWIGNSPSGLQCLSWRTLVNLLRTRSKC